MMISYNKIVMISNYYDFIRSTTGFIVVKNVINQFKHDCYFLSNMFPCNVTVDGRTYKCAESAFQSMKTNDPRIKDQFITMTGYEARSFGKYGIKLNNRSVWNQYRVKAMMTAVWMKFSQNPEPAKKLIDSYPNQLIEGNDWYDTFWGVDLKTGKGENKLGKILMKIRSYMMTNTEIQ